MPSLRAVAAGDEAASDTLGMANTGRETDPHGFIYSISMLYKSYHMKYL
jgi:hypothetical protein